jgi:hypothetical protein
VAVLFDVSVASVVKWAERAGEDGQPSRQTDGRQAALPARLFTGPIERPRAKAEAGRPGLPSSLERCTKPRGVCPSIPRAFAGESRERPSRILAIAKMSRPAWRQQGVPPPRPRNVSIPAGNLNQHDAASANQCLAASTPLQGSLAISPSQVFGRLGINLYPA